MIADAETTAAVMQQPSEHEAAAVLYPTMMKAEMRVDASAQPERSEPGSEVAIAERLYQSPPAPHEMPVPDNIQELRAGEKSLFNPADAFSDIDFDADIRSSADAEGVDMPDAMRAGFAKEYRQMFADLGVSGQEAREVADLLRHTAREPTSQEQFQAWEGESLKRLRETNVTHGDLEMAKHLAQRDPRVKQILEATGLGNHPTVVLRFVELARRERLRGRL